MNLRFVCFLIAVSAACGLLSAQSVTSQINGTVVDQQGSAVPSAEIVVVGAGTNAQFTTKANGRGEWIVPSLPTATYRVTVTSAGFQTANVDNVRLEPGK